MTGPFIICVGNVVRDEVFHVEELPSAGLKTDVLHYEERFGGPAATAAVAIAHLGGRAAYWGRIGTDAVGVSVIDALTRHNVDTSGVAVIPGGRTTRAVVTVDRRGERSIMIDRLGLPRETNLLPPKLPDDASVVLVDTLDKERRPTSCGVSRISHLASSPSPAEPKAVSGRSDMRSRWFRPSRSRYATRRGAAMCFTALMRLRSAKDSPRWNRPGSHQQPPPSRLRAATGGKVCLIVDPYSRFYLRRMWNDGFGTPAVAR